MHFDGLRLDDVAYISEETHREMNGTSVRPRDVLLNITGASIGRCSFVPDGFGEANVNQHVCIIRSVTQLNHKFLYYCLSAPLGQDQIFSSFTGASRQGLGLRDLGIIEVPLPQISDQTQIAAYLDASCAAIDAAVAAKRRQLETLKDVRNSLIEVAVTRGIDPCAPMRRVDQDWIAEIPTHWETLRIKRIVSRVDYGISQSTEKEGRYPVLKMGHIEAGELQLTKFDFVDEVCDDLLLEHGDLLYNRTNSPDLVGKAAIFRGTKSDAITFASYLVRLRTNHQVNPHFLNYVINSTGFLAFARKLAIPSVQQSNLNSTRYCRIFVPLPSFNEQGSICEYLDEKMEELGRIVAGIDAQIDTLIAYRKSLIHKCVTGQRRISEQDIRRVGKSPVLKQEHLAETRG